MAITVSIALTNVGPTFADSPLSGICTITNNGANTIQVQGIQLTEQTNTGAAFRNPDFLVPNVAPGTYPTIASSASANYPFSVVCPSPNMPGASPAAPNAYRGGAQPANPLVNVVCVVTAYDSTAAVFVNGSASMQIAVVSSVAPFPVPQGGASQFNFGGDAVNWFFF